MAGRRHPRERGLVLGCPAGPGKISSCSVAVLLWLWRGWGRHRRRARSGIGQFGAGIAARAIGLRCPSRAKDEKCNENEEGNHQRQRSPAYACIAAIYVIGRAMAVVGV